jgi:hypothetical protein
VTGSEACTLGGHGGEEVVRLGKEGEEGREEGGGGVSKANCAAPMLTAATTQPTAAAVTDGPRE